MTLSAPVPVSVFEDTDLFTIYDCEITILGKLIAGVPKDPKIIEGWIRTKAGIDDAVELQMMLRRTIDELGLDHANLEDVEHASKYLAGLKQTCGFKTDEDGPYIEARQVKAMLKEAVNVLYSGEQLANQLGWTKTKKGARNAAAERVFVTPDRIHMGRSEPDGVHTQIGHVNGPGGPRSTLGYHEYVEGAVLRFQVHSLGDCVKPDQWALIWKASEKLGLGTLRSQGFGQFHVTGWTRQSD